MQVHESIAITLRVLCFCLVEQDLELRRLLLLSQKLDIVLCEAWVIDRCLSFNLAILLSGIEVDYNLLSGELEEQVQLVNWDLRNVCVVRALLSCAELQGELESHRLDKVPSVPQVSLVEDDVLDLFRAALPLIYFLFI